MLILLSINKYTDHINVQLHIKILITINLNKIVLILQKYISKCI